MKLSLVTGTLNRPESFGRLLRSIVECTTVDWELVVSDASDVLLTSDNPRVRLIAERPRLGCTRGYNRAFLQARGEWVIWLNDDAEVLPGYDVAAIRFMEKHPNIGLGALAYSETGGPFRVNSAWGSVYSNFGIISRDLGNAIGWMDEDLIMYGNDNSLTFRVLLANKGVAEVPHAQVLHHSVKDQLRIENQKYRERDGIVLHQKYMPLRSQWLATYQRYALPIVSSEWPHGLRPDVVLR